MFLKKVGSKVILLEYIQQLNLQILVNLETILIQFLELYEESQQVEGSELPVIPWYFSKQRIYYCDIHENICLFCENKVKNIRCYLGTNEYSRELS